jgi:hypothetical protein
VRAVGTNVTDAVAKKFDESQRSDSMAGLKTEFRSRELDSRSPLTGPDKHIVKKL